ncbi:alpha/beta fold hydrolase [Alcanivorax sp. 1008]|uniref:alpha/beta fold hydrolase n=1 Tax=Alcanivorax sp. 1008 TaxID=2816853 RepID=UPI001DE0EA77|nr:alpha/beta hydrolase [Alcanivorax sp. 1008]MCC1497741.1 alpha/beta hydrolase [Alcanivorax sp. 1008]
MRTWVLLRGLIREQRHWGGFPEQMQAALPEDRIVTVDLPGNGSLCQTPSPTRIEDMVAALRKSLSDQDLRPPFHVVALSLGAMTTISWINDYPGEVAAAALINSSVARFSPFWQRLRPANYRSIVMDGLLARSLIQKERAILAMTTNLTDTQTQEDLAVEWAEFARQNPVSRANSLRQLLAAARFHAPIRLAGSAPVLIVNGAGDRLVDPRCSAAMARGWGLPIRVHPTAGHDLTLDAGEWAAEVLQQWVRSA